MMRSGRGRYEEVTDWRYDPELEWYGGELGGGYDYDYLATFRALLGSQDSDTNITNSFGNSSHLFPPTGDQSKTEAELKTKSTYTDAGWDFDKIWHISDGDYPILKWRQSSNFAPMQLISTAELTITENQPTGSIVGKFNAMDPEGGAITYRFVNGDNNNSLFTLDINGTLKIATTFDYESNASSYTIYGTG